MKRDTVRDTSKRKKLHSLLYFIFLTGLAVSLPVSVFMTSVFEQLLALNWLAEGGFRKKYEIFRTRKALWLVLSIYLVHLLGMLYTADIQHGFHDLRIKLPLLALPLIIATTEGISGSRQRILIFFFTASILVHSLISISILFNVVDYELLDVRQISLFISHIRFSLMINLAIYSLLYVLFDKNYRPAAWVSTLIAIVILWLIIFLVLLQSITGIIIFLAAGFILFLVRMKHIPNMMLRWFLFVTLMTLPLLFLSYITKSITRFYTVEPVDRQKLDEFTQSGNRYKHYFEEDAVENGRYVWLYVCEEELEQEWNRRSELDYHGTDKKGQGIRYTLTRYMTSLGLRKDSAGMAALTDEDIRNVENGMANHIYSAKFSLYPKIHEVIWQADNFRKGGNPSGHSVTQRLLYMQAALAIISENPVIGVGTGDILDAYRDYYNAVDSPLEDRWRLRAHNQYLTFMVTFGLLGFAWILFAFIYPVSLERKWNSYYFLVFFLVGFMSMLNEDTLETHIGVSFFAFFYSLFLFGLKDDKADG